MPDQEPTCAELNDFILQSLARHNANELSTDIRRIVERGTVLAGQATTYSKKSKTHRQMTEPEMLAISVAYITAALEVPLMLEVAKRKLGIGAIGWSPLPTGLDDEPRLLAEIERIDTQALRAALDTVVRLVTELGLRIPEVG